MKAYQLNVPTKVYFGRNIWEEAIHERQQFFQGNVFIVTTGRSLIRLGYLEKLKRVIQELPYVNHTIVFDHVSANPRLAEALEGVSLGKKEKADIVVGFGGGSALDAAKAIAAGIGHEEGLEAFFYDHKEPSEKTLPVVAIPTTAGTGSELSRASILTDDRKKVKGGIRGTALYPRLAIVDSLFTETVPARITMETGFDVLAHAVESYISRAATPFTEMQSEYAIRTVGEYLPGLMADPGDREAREKMSFASMIMGINLSNASTCLPHRMQYPVGAHTDTSHGQGLAALFGAWVFHEYPYAGKKLEKALYLLTGTECKDGLKAAEVTGQLIRDLKLPAALHEIGVTEPLIGEMINEVSGNIQNDPASEEDSIIEKIYRKAF